MNLSSLTIEKARELLDDRQISAVELTRHFLDQIDQKNKALNVFLTVSRKQALKEAEIADEKIKNNQANYLTGIPLAIKDNILVKDEVCTAGSKILENYKASYDATVITRLKRENAIFLGKTNLDEFAMGSSTENSAYNATKNPHNLDYVPGGSSGGSAAAVAADLCLASLGTDTGGSIRQPASFCGVVGLKPTYGAVSRFGAIALGSSLDQIGPLAKTIKDAQMIFEIISGRDTFDATTVEKSIKDHAQEMDIKDLVIGCPKEYFELSGLNAQVKETVEKAISWYESQGAKIKEISLPHTVYALPAYYIIQPAEASANLARYDGIRYGEQVKSDDLLSVYAKSRGQFLGREVQRRIMLGTYTLSSGYYDAYYLKAQKVRALIRQDFQKAFEEVDVIMSPVSPTTAFKFGEKTQNPLEMYAADIYTVPVNLAGICGMSINCGLINNLPVGLQILGPWFQEGLLFSVGKFYEELH